MYADAKRRDVQVLLSAGVPHSWRYPLSTAGRRSALGRESISSSTGAVRIDGHLCCT